MADTISGLFSNVSEDQKIPRSMADGDIYVPEGKDLERDTGKDNGKRQDATAPKHLVPMLREVLATLRQKYLALHHILLRKDLSSEQKLDNLTKQVVDAVATTGDALAATGETALEQRNAMWRSSRKPFTRVKRVNSNAKNNCAFHCVGLAWAEKNGDTYVMDESEAASVRTASDTILKTFDTPELDLPPFEPLADLYRTYDGFKELGLEAPTSAEEVTVRHLTRAYCAPGRAGSFLNLSVGLGSLELNHRV
jgi:hypothetical protein